jgi:hypothetical protein
MSIVPMPLLAAVNDNCSFSRLGYQTDGRGGKQGDC